MKTTFKYDHYFDYAELKADLEYLAEKYPSLTDLDVNCVTEEGRNQYVLTITNKETGNALSKPGWYLDGNIHAGEITASMCAMHTIDYLLTNYGEDKAATKIIDEYTVYVIPRVTPDGAETYFKTPYSLRSVNREYLPEKGGIVPEDIDGDGVIRMMRIKTPYGAWKIDPANKDQMVKRSPSDFEGDFYDIYKEGYLESFDGDENLKEKKADWGLDFNRNFPYGWFADHRQKGAGKYPFSNTETKALADFVLAHPNIGGAAIGHTSGGLVLSPPGTRPESTISHGDAESFKQIANMGKEELGYIPINIFDSFMSDQSHYDSGALDDWMYQTQGIIAYTIEFWNLAEKAGVPVEWGQKKAPRFDKTIERFNACMAWVKEHAPRYYSEWKEFDHPALGKVEIGGFNIKRTLQNPPEEYLLNECENDTKFNMRFVLSMPKLSIDDIEAEEVEKGIFKVTVTVGNKGYLPTNISDEAVTLKVNKPVKVSIKGAEIIAGKETQEIGDLSGFGRTDTGVFFYGNISTNSNAKARKKLSWIVKGEKGSKICIIAAQEKAGCSFAETVL